jgi:hypothetical protein
LRRKRDTSQQEGAQRPAPPSVRDQLQMSSALVSSTVAMVWLIGFS